MAGEVALEQACCVAVRLAFGDARAEEYDAIVIPGGWAPDSLRQDNRVLKLVRDMDRMGKVVAAICHAGWMLASADVIRGNVQAKWEGHEINTARFIKPLRTMHAIGG